MLRNSLLWVLLVLVLLLGAASWFGHGKPTEVTDLPWQVERLPEGASRVFGVTLGRTTARELDQRLHSVPRVALFESSNGHLSLEAYYGTLTLGMFEARLEVTLDASAGTLRAFAASAIARQPTVTGAWRMELTEQTVHEALGLPIVGITYVPRVRYDVDLALKSFGKPATRIEVADGQTYWLYPDRGLALLRHSDGRAMLHYVAPSAFPAVRARIEGMAGDYAKRG
ncbi:hypothetical protein [Acidihalobacter aeolianus]|uniref:hypothetical protein n=1 Tax=Acidihalobacter aeolianus TaxID=2792603 RepID=UPI0009F3BC68|nr:hypothetical protein [Acidihalobacter aeolianus]